MSLEDDNVRTAEDHAERESLLDALAIFERFARKPTSVRGDASGGGGAGS